MILRFCSTVATCVYLMTLVWLFLAFWLLFDNPDVRLVDSELDKLLSDCLDILDNLDGLDDCDSFDDLGFLVFLTGWAGWAGWVAILKVDNYTTTQLSKLWFLNIVEYCNTLRMQSCKRKHASKPTN